MKLRPALLLLLAASFLGVAEAGPAFRKGRKADQAGHAYEAAVEYVEALASNPKLKKASKALKVVSSSAYAEKLGAAQAAEADGDHAAAWRAYGDLDRLVVGLRRFDALSFGAIDTAPKVAEQAELAAGDAYAAAEAALAGQRFADAIAQYRAATTFVGGYRDTTDKVRTSLYQWAEADVAAHRYRDAIGHYVDCWRAGSTSDAQQRAVTIEVALGAYLIERGGCRQAVDEARRALAIAPRPDADALLARATACARTPLALVALDNATGSSPSWVSVPDTLADGILAGMRREASEFVELIDPQRFTTMLREQGLGAYVGRVPPSAVQGVDYVVLGRITELAARQDGPSVRRTSLPVTYSYDDEVTASDGSTSTERKTREVPVTYEQVTGRASASVALTLRVVDVRTGAQVGVETLRATRSDEVDAARNPRKPDGGELTLSSSGFADTYWSEALDGLLSGNAELKTKDVLLREVLDELTASASARIVQWVDTPPTVPDPPTLSLVFE